MPFRIAVESPLQDDIRVLIAELNAYLLSIFPPEACSHMTVEQMNQPDTTVFVARDDHGHQLGGTHQARVEFLSRVEDFLHQRGIRFVRGHRGKRTGSRCRHGHGIDARRYSRRLC